MAFEIAEGVVPIKARDDTAAGIAQAKARMAGLKAVAQIDADDERLRRKVAACQRELDALAKKKATPEVDARTEAAQAKMRNLRAQAEQLDRMRVSVTADANTAVANARLREVGSQASRSQNSVGGLNAEGRRIGGSFGSSTRAVALITAIGAAAGVAGGLVAALPAALGSLAGIGGVLVGSLSGVGEALKGYSADQDAASASAGRGASAAASNARAMRDAQQTVADARRNAARVARDSAQSVEDADRNMARVARDGAQAVEDAQEQQTRTREEGARAVERASTQVRSALDDQRRAQDDLNDSYAQAQRQLEDLVDRTNDYGLSVEGAEISLQRQQARTDEVMASSTATALDRREALYDLAVAEDRLRDAQRDSTRSQDELRAAQAAGIAGSEVVTTARERLAEASDRTRDAEANLQETIADAARANQDAAETTAQVSQQAAEANTDAARAFMRAQQQAAEANDDAARQVTDALQGVRDAMAQQAEQAAAGTKASSKFADAMAKLTPAARGLVNQLIRMGPLVDRLKLAAQSEFLPGLTQMLRDSEGLFPIFEGFLSRTSAVMGKTARDMGALFKNPEYKRDLQALLDSTLPITQSLGDGLVQLTRDWADFGAKMAPATQGFATMLDGVFDMLSGLFDALEPHADSFKRTFEALARVFRELGPVIGDLVVHLSDILGPVLEDLAGWLERNRGSVDEWVLAIVGAIAVIKGVKTVGNFISWAGGVAEGFANIARKAGDADAKTKGLDGRLRGLKAIGAIGVVIAVDQATNGAISNSLNVASGQAPIDQNDPRRDMFGALPPVPGDENDIRNLPATLQRIKGSSDKNWSELTTGASNWGRDTWSSVTGWWGRTFTDSDSWFSRTKTSIGNHLTGAKDGAVTRAGSLWSGVSGWWGRTFTDSDSTFSRVRTTVGDRMQGARNWAVERASSLSSGVAGWWGRTFTDSDSTFSRVRNTIGDRLQSARNTAVERAGSLWSGVTGWWNRTFGDSNSTFGRIRTSIGDFMRGARENAVNWARSAYDGVTSWFSRMWAGLKDMGRTGVNGVIRALNWLSGKANVVLRFLRVPTIPEIAYMEQGGRLGAQPQMLARGGRVGGGFMTNGPQAIVGEGNQNHPEYVIPTDPRYRRRAAALFGSLAGDLGMTPQAGVPMLAEGGILGWFGNAARDVWGGISNFASSVGSKLTDAMTWVGGTVGNIGAEVLDAVRGMLPAEPWRGLGGAITGRAFDGIRKSIEGSFMSSGDPGGAGVQRWAPLVLRALSMMGQPASLLNTVLRRMNQESGGNPRAINNWDINAKRGTPSKGLMQTIDPTFRAYHFPGTSWDPYDPLANILASMRYAMSRYGSLPAAYNRPGGYAVGGRVPGVGTRDNQLLLAQPGERVLTRSQNASFERLVSALERNEGRGTGQVNHITIQQVGQDAQETARFVALGLRAVA